MDKLGDGIFPDEVVMQILARLPVKSLFRSKSVCKLWETPKFVTEIISFMGLTGYYRRFIEGFSKLVFFYSVDSKGSSICVGCVV